MSKRRASNGRVALVAQRVTSGRTNIYPPAPPPSTLTEPGAAIAMASVRSRTVSGRDPFATGVGVWQRFLGDDRRPSAAYPSLGTDPMGTDRPWGRRRRPSRKRRIADDLYLGGTWISVRRRSSILQLGPPIHACLEGSERPSLTDDSWPRPTSSAAGLRNERPVWPVPR
jgi:hypothetical protein